MNRKERKLKHQITRASRRRRLERDKQKRAIVIERSQTGDIANVSVKKICLHCEKPHIEPGTHEQEWLQIEQCRQECAVGQLVSHV